MLLNSFELSGGQELPFCALYAPDSKDQAQTIWLNGSGKKDGLRLQTDRFFSKMLVDQIGHYWLAEQANESKETTKLCVFDQQGRLLKSLSVKGRPSLSESGSSVFAGCEGRDGKARIYEFSKKSLSRVKQWTMDGFLWGLKKEGNFLYAACYLPDENLAVLYIMGENQQMAVELGENFFPTDLSVLGGLFYIAACPVMGGSGKKLIQLDESLETVREFSLMASPRQIFSFGSEMVIHALELNENQEDKLICLDLKTGKQKERLLPYSCKIKKNADQLFLVNPKEHSIFQWDSARQEMIKVSCLPDNRNQEILDFYCEL